MERLGPRGSRRTRATQRSNPGSNPGVLHGCDVRARRIRLRASSHHRPHQGGPTWLSRSNAQRATPRSGRSRSRSPRRTSRTCVRASRPRACPRGRPSRTTRRACRSRLMQELARYWATEYDWRKCEARLNAAPELRHRDRRARHPLHPRPLQARGRAAAGRLPRLAGLGRRAAEAHRPAHRPDRARRERVGRLPRGDPVDAGLRVLRQADQRPAGIPCTSARPTSS